jgi:hypothetical protein
MRLRLTTLLLFVSLSTLVPAQEQIQHVIVVVQENRSTDNLFGSNPTFEPGVDIVSPRDPKITCFGKSTPLTAVPLDYCYDIGHGRGGFVDTCDLDPHTKVCKMDGACSVRLYNKCSHTPENPAYRFVDNSQGAVQPYFDIATWYGFANRMFQTNQGSSVPAHMFLFSGTSAPVYYPDKYYDWYVADGAGRPDPASPSCLAPPAEFVRLVDPRRSEGNCHKVDGQHCQFSCFDHPTLTDLINASNLSWRWYTPTANFAWTTPSMIKHICEPHAGDKICRGPDWQQHVVVDPKQVLTDLGADPKHRQCNLANVSWVIPDGKYSDHAGGNKGLGPSWVASIVNAVGEDPNHCGYWPNTVILVTWDDWGGWYDHVPPFSASGYLGGGGNGRQYVYGFRVPLLVVSAYSPVAGHPGFVSSHTHDFGSILAFIEHVFGLPEVDHQYGYPYADHFAPELGEGLPYALADFFNFSQQARQFHPIPAPAGAQHFLNDSSPPEDPDNDADDPD